MQKLNLFRIVLVVLGLSIGSSAHCDQIKAKELDVQLQFEDNAAAENDVNNSENSSSPDQNDSNVINVYGGDDSGQENGDDNYNKSLQSQNVGSDSASVQYYLLGDVASNILVLSQQEGIYNRELEKLAKQQAENNSQLQDSKKQIEKRNKMEVFIYGPNFKALKIISELENQSNEMLNKLNSIAEKIDNIEIQSSIKQQASILKKDNQGLRKYIDDKEDVFSLFGWLIKRF